MIRRPPRSTQPSLDLINHDSLCSKINSYRNENYQYGKYALPEIQAKEHRLLIISNLFIHFYFHTCSYLSFSSYFLFAGFAPLSKPRFALVVNVNAPKAGKFYGGVVSGPVFREVMSRALQLYNIKPDKQL